MNTEKIERLRQKRLSYEMMDLDRWSLKRDQDRVDLEIFRLENEDLRARVAELEAALEQAAHAPIPVHVEHVEEPVAYVADVPPAPALDDDEAIEIAFYDAFKASVVELPQAAPGSALEAVPNGRYAIQANGELLIENGWIEVLDKLENTAIVDFDLPDGWLLMRQRPATAAGEEE